MREFNFKKKYGQNFLIDNNVLNKITDCLNVTEKDLIIEIGPGSGNLTNKLIQFNCKIIAYEIDIDVKPYLDRIDYSELSVVYDDILNRSIIEDVKNIKYENLYIIGNLPYYITTPIIEKLTKENLNPKEMFFMVQKEVADRLSSKPGVKEYGYITVFLNYHYDIEKMFDVSRKSFMPAPNVESSIIKLTSHGKYKVKSEELFNEVISNAFKHKRKTLLNNLKMYDKSAVEKVLVNNNLSNLIRAEDLPIEIFLEITNAL